MTKPEIGDRVRAIISDHLQKFGRPAEVTDASTLHDVGLDSLDQIEITFAIEDEFELELTDAEVEDLVKVGDLVELIGGKCGLDDPDADICSVCAKPIPPSSPVRYYDDIGEVHAICGGATPDQNKAGGRIKVDPDEFSGPEPAPEYVDVYLSDPAPESA